MWKPSTFIFLTCIASIFFGGCEARTCTYEEYNKCGWLYPFPVWDADPEVCNYTLSQINCVEKVNYACKSNPYGYSYSSFWGTKKYGSKVVLARGIETSITYQEQFKMWGCVAPTCSYSEIDKCTQLERDLPVRTSSEKRCKQLLSGQSCLHKINEDCKSSPYATSTLRTKGNETLELIRQKIHNWGCLNVINGGIGQECKYRVIQNN